jgi:hypothetical protein
MTSCINHQALTALLRRLEAGVRADGRFNLVSNPEIVYGLEGPTARITVRIGRKKATQIAEHNGDTAEEVVSNLLARLDSTYEAYK